MSLLRRTVTSIKENFYLRKHIPSPETIKLLKTVYPNIDWNRVDFYEGLPWFTPLIAPYVTAQALPQFYSFKRFSIYIKKMDESRAQCLADIVHEGLHVLQGFNMWKGYGIGIFRGFTLHYIALFSRYGYRNNPLEIPAYDQEFRFLNFCAQNGQHGIMPKINTAIFDKIDDKTGLVFRNYPYPYKVVGPFRLAMSFLLCLGLVIIKPVLDVVAYLVRLFVKDRSVTEKPRS
jgi:hypothetical protein